MKQGGRRGLLGCRVPPPWDFAERGGGQGGLVAGRRGGKACRDRAAEPPGFHQGVPRVGAAGRPGSLRCTATALEDFAGGWVT